jgi:hypothetical protein
MWNPLKRKSDQSTDRAAAVGDAVDDPLDDTALGLDVWVQGVNPIVEYVSFDYLFRLIHLFPRLSYSLTAANRHGIILALSQYMALTATEKRPGRPRTTSIGSEIRICSRPSYRMLE